MTDTSGPKDGGPAYPDSLAWNRDQETYGEPGMTRRQWLAGMAMQGMLSAMETTGGMTEEQMTTNFAAVAYIQADAMLRYEREEGK